MSKFVADHPNISNIRVHMTGQLRRTGIIFDCWAISCRHRNIIGMGPNTIGTSATFLTIPGINYIYPTYFFRSHSTICDKIIKINWCKDGIGIGFLDRLCNQLPAECIIIGTIISKIVFCLIGSSYCNVQL